MKNVLWKVLLLYFLGICDYNVFSPTTKSCHVMADKRNGDYTCDDVNGKPERVVMNAHEIDFADSKDDEIMFVDIDKDPKEKFDHTVSFPKGGKLILRNIQYIGLPLGTYYRDGNKKVRYITRSLRFYICPSSDANKNWFYFRSLIPNQFIREFHGANRCGFGICEYGLVFNIPNGEKEKILGGGTSDRALYIAFTEGDKYPLLLKQPKANGLNMPLVACPYVNWISKYSLIEFQPKEYLLDSFPIVPSNDFDRHRLIPTFRYTKHNLPGDSGDQKVDSFICGNLKQKKFPPVEIGFQLEKSEEPKIHDLVFNGTNILCNSINIQNEYVFGLVEADMTVLNKNNDLTFFTVENKLYSGQYLLVYNKYEIGKRRNDLLAKNNNHIHKGDYDFLAWDHEEQFYFMPKCIGKFEDVSATLKLKVNEEVLTGELMPDKTTPLYKIGEIQKSTTLSCHAVKDGEHDSRYSHFYHKRFNTYIQRIENEHGKPVSDEALEKIVIHESLDNISGKYKCTLNKAVKHSKIKSSEFIIKFKYKKYSFETINAFKMDKDVVKCSVKNESNIIIDQMVVIVPGDKNYTYNHEKNDNKGRFKLTHDHVIFTFEDGLSLKNTTKFDCIYKENSDFVLKQSKIVYINENTLEEDKLSKKIFIPSIVIGVILVLITLAIIVFCAFVKRRRKKKTHLLSAASSASSASSMSRSSMSGLSNRKSSKTMNSGRSASKTSSKIKNSQSTSRTSTRNKRSNSKF